MRPDESMERISHVDDQAGAGDSHLALSSKEESDGANKIAGQACKGIPEDTIQCGRFGYARKEPIRR